jgi:hypothetical protein
MSTTPAVLPERLKELDDLTVDHGGHSDGEKHTAAPSCTSPVLTSFLVRLNDSLPDEARQQLKPYLPKVIGTRGDGKDELRGWLASDWLIRTALPTWLDLAGAEESATALRELPQVTAETIDNSRSVVQRIRQEALKLRAAARESLRSKVYEAVKEKLADKADAAAAADAAADAAAAADADAPSLRAAVRRAVRKAVAEKLEPQKVALLPSALELLDKMIDPEGAAA